MSEQPVLFRFENSIGRFVNAIVHGLLLWSIMGCWLSLLATLLIAAVFAKYMPEASSRYVWPLLFLFILGWMFIPGLKNWIWLLNVENDKLSLKTTLGKTRAILRNEIVQTELGHDKIKLSSSTQTLMIYPKSLPWKEQILFKSLITDWLPIPALPIEWQEGRSKLLELIKAESVVCSVKWKSIISQSMQVDEMGVHHIKGKRQQMFLWTEVEAVSLEFHRSQFSFWVDGRREQIRYQKLNEKQLNEIAYALRTQMLKHQIPFEVKTFA